MTVTMNILRPQISHPTHHFSKKSKDIQDSEMGISRSHTTHHLTSHFHFHKSASSKDLKEPPMMGIPRSSTDPLDKTPSKDSNSTANSSGRSSGSSSPRRKTASMDIVRNIRERPTSAIPKFHVLAEQLHKYKMRNCPGMYCTDEESAGIKEMKKWDWKHAHHPGEQPPPVGPKNETWHFEGLALQQVDPRAKSGSY